jgi:hypothetical protein
LIFLFHEHLIYSEKKERKRMKGQPMPAKSEGDQNKAGLAVPS